MAVTIIPSKPHNCGQKEVEAYSEGELSTTLKTVEVDYCLADIVAALNKAGIYTLGSCCGHGESQTGGICLSDGRILEITFPEEWTRHKVNMFEVERGQ